MTAFLVFVTGGLLVAAWLISAWADRVKPDNELAVTLVGLFGFFFLVVAAAHLA